MLIARVQRSVLALAWGLLMHCGPDEARAGVVYEATSPYHHIRVVDERGIRTLSFDRSMETRMSLRDPLQGHFEYTEYFHMPWLWTSQMKRVLMIGLGGGSTQRSYNHYYPTVVVDTVEIDSAVVDVAKRFFHLKDSAVCKVHIADGRVHLRRSKERYDAILLDAYASSRYGSSIPHHLATKEFFQIASEHLDEKGVLAYNVMGSWHQWRSGLVGAMYRTLKAVFPQVYLFPARDSQNIVMIGTKSAEKLPFDVLHERALTLIHDKRVTLPTFHQRLYSFQADVPPSAARAPILTDDFSPIDGLMKMGN